MFSKILNSKKKGNALKEKKDYDGAIEQYNKAIEIEPNYVKVI